ncbi:MAG TPA: hypothetical protein V6D14_19795 [Coleofasciculaceae cyanobacterium]|jgi:hypothetical protein
MMTDRTNEPQQYWYVQVPKNKFPKAKFYLGQQVGLPGEDDLGNSYYDIGEIIGMKYLAYEGESAQWHYLVRYLKCDYNPSLVGSVDAHFCEESRLVDDYTAIAL